MRFREKMAWLAKFLIWYDQSELNDSYTLKHIIVRAHERLEVSNKISRSTILNGFVSVPV